MDEIDSYSHMAITSIGRHISRYSNNANSEYHTLTKKQRDKRKAKNKQSSKSRKKNRK